MGLVNGSKQTENGLNYRRVMVEALKTLRIRPWNAGEGGYPPDSHLAPSHDSQHHRSGIPRMPSVGQLLYLNAVDVSETQRQEVCFLVGVESSTWKWQIPTLPTRIWTQQDEVGTLGQREIDG